MDWPYVGKLLRRFVLKATRSQMAGRGLWRVVGPFSFWTIYSLSKPNQKYNVLLVVNARLEAGSGASQSQGNSPSVPGELVRKVT